MQTPPKGAKIPSAKQKGTNTYLVGTGPSRILIDTGAGHPRWRELLQQILGSTSPAIEISAVLLTHHHADHCLGVPDVRSLCPATKVYKHLPVEEPGQLDIHDGQVFAVEDASSLTAVLTPGHTADHVVFVLLADAAGHDDDNEGMIMFTGDSLLGHGTAVFEDLDAYMQTLERMRDLIGERCWAYPGHGAVVEDARKRLEGYIRHRREREEEILSVLRDRRERDDQGGDTGMNVGEIVQVVYKDVDEALHLAAQGGVRQVLAKLEKEDRVRRTESRWEIIRK